MNENNNVNPQPVPQQLQNPDLATITMQSMYPGQAPNPEPQVMQAPIEAAPPIDPQMAAPQVEIQPAEATFNNTEEGMQTTFIELNEEAPVSETKFDKKMIVFMGIIFAIILVFIIALPYIARLFN